MKLQISIDGKSYEAEVEILEEDAAPCPPQHGASQPPQAALKPAPAAAAKAPPPAAEEAADNANVCRSPVTGVVIKVNVAPGDTVQANASIMVLEAMKMETNVTANRAGKVKKVRVAGGDAVKVGQVVVEFE